MSPKKVAILHPSKSPNLGDLVILEGVRALLDRVLPSWEEEVWNLPKAETDPVYLDSLDFDVDIFVLSGTPWLWDKCHQSRKYHVLRAVLERLNKNCKKVAMGIGSCFPLATNAMEIYMFQKDGDGIYEITRQHTREQIFELFSQFSLIFTRDRFAFNLLKAVNVSNVFDSICPAFFLNPKFDRTQISEERPLLIFTNPWDGVSRESCDNYFLSDFIQFQKYFYDKFNPRVVTMDSLDLDWCKGQNWDATLLNSVEDLEKELKDASFVLSGRVHAVVPALVYLKKAYIIPWDTRFLTAVRGGACPVLPISDNDWFGYDFQPATSDFSGEVRKRIQSNLNFVQSKLTLLGENK